MRIAAAVCAAVLAGCGGGDDDGAAPGQTAASPPAKAKSLSDEEQIERVGTEWATLFGRGDEAACDLAVGSLGDQRVCDIYAGGRPTAFARSFDGARIESIAIRHRDQLSTACVDFDNGERVGFTEVGELSQLPAGVGWGPSNLGGNDPCD
ncbi:MAG: hypothetical protein ACRD2Z_09790 [Thermoanaerobaculia bacterium]